MPEKRNRFPSDVSFFHADGYQTLALWRVIEQFFSIAAPMWVSPAVGGHKVFPRRVREVCEKHLETSRFIRGVRYPIAVRGERRIAHRSL
jgi:hypothetical protein